MKTFFHHLVHIDDVVAQIDTYKIDPNDREELSQLVHQIFQNHTLNIILNHLPKDKHREFLDQFKLSPHDAALLDFLKKEIKLDIEAAIRSQSERIKKDLLSEIKKSHKK